MSVVQSFARLVGRVNAEDGEQDQAPRKPCNIYGLLRSILNGLRLEMADSPEYMH